MRAGGAGAWAPGTVANRPPKAPGRGHGLPEARRVLQTLLEIHHQLHGRRAGGGIRAWVCERVRVCGACVCARVRCPVPSSATNPALPPCDGQSARPISAAPPPLQPIPWWGRALGGSRFGCTVPGDRAEPSAHPVAPTLLVPVSAAPALSVQVSVAPTLSVPVYVAPALSVPVSEAPALSVPVSVAPVSVSNSSVH